jgi:predicted lactoylglutathione lyase
MYQQMIFVNLPVENIDASRTFYTALGYSINEQFSDESTASVVISDTIIAMLLTQDLGFIYGRSFDDLDGHTWVVVWMDPAAVEG